MNLHKKNTLIVRIITVDSKNFEKFVYVVNNPNHDVKKFLAATIIICLIGILSQVFLNRRKKLGLIICFVLNLAACKFFIFYKAVNVLLNNLFYFLLKP